MKELFKGILSTPMTPFDNNGNLNLKYIQNYVEWQKSCGINGFYILGTWGGFALQTKNERLKVAEAYNNATKKLNMQLIVNVTSPSINETIELAKEAEKIGITAISSTLPIYYSTAGYLTIDDYKRYFSNLCEKVNLPVFLYNNPRTTNILISPNQFIELVKVGLSGVKDGSKNIGWLLKTQKQLQNESLRAEIIPGNSVGILYGFLYGTKAATSGASVVFPKETFKILESFQNGEISKAAAQHKKVLKLREIMNICSSPPSSAHFILKKINHSLGVPRSTWPKVNEKIGEKMMFLIKEVLNN